MSGESPQAKREATRNERDLLVRWRTRRDERAREQLIRMHMPMARALARRYGRSSEPFEDLLQVASVGLVKAIDRYDPERGGSLRSFAVPTILGEVRRYFRDCGWSVHVPRGTQELALRVRDAQQRLAEQLGRDPDVARIAEYLEVELEDAIDALSALRSYESLSLDARPPGAPQDATPIVELLGDEDRGYEDVVLAAAANAALRALPARERRIIGLRYLEELSQAEIAERVGLSQMQVSRVLRRSMDRLQAAAASETAAGPG